MRLNTIRYYLHTYKGIQEQIAEITENLNTYRIMNIEDFIFPCTGQAVETQRYKHNAVSEVEQISIPRLDYIRKQEQELFRLTTIRSAINAVILQYDEKSNEWQILKLRYFEKDRKGRSRTWYRIADMLGYSEQHVKRIDSEICGAIARELWKLRQK